MEGAPQLRRQRRAASRRLDVFARADFTDILRRAREATAPGFFLTLLRPLLDVARAAATLIALAAGVGAWSPWLLCRDPRRGDPDAGGRGRPLSPSSSRGPSPRARLRDDLAKVLASCEAAKRVRTYDLAPWLL